MYYNIKERGTIVTREEFDVLDIHEQINIANTELLKILY